MLCSATADLWRCASFICLLCSLIRSWMDVQYKPCRIHMGCCIYPVFLIPVPPWLVKGSWIFFLGGRATLLMLCLVSILLSRPCVVWVYGMYAVKVGLSFVLVVCVASSMAHCVCEGCIHCPWRWWWENLVLGWRNHGHRVARTDCLLTGWWCKFWCR